MLTWLHELMCEENLMHGIKKEWKKKDASKDGFVIVAPYLMEKKTLQLFASWSWTGSKFFWFCYCCCFSNASRWKAIPWCFCFWFKFLAGHSFRVCFYLVGKHLNLGKQSVFKMVLCRKMVSNLGLKSDGCVTFILLTVIYCAR